jgi:phosphoglycerate dehydrogenase-like enzyme
LHIVSPTIFRSALAVLRAEGWHVDARSGRSPDQLAADLHEADAVVVRSATKITAALIAAAPRLRAIARAGTGVDNVDVSAANARGIVVMNAPAPTASAWPSSPWRSCCAGTPHPARDAAMKQGKWEKKKFLGEEVSRQDARAGRLGRIGQEVGPSCRAFGMHLVAHDPFLSEQVAADYGVASSGSTSVFATADYVALHLPSTARRATW